MDNNIYIALSRQLGIFNQFDVIANNIANINTTGYQADKLQFREYLSSVDHDNTLSFTHDGALYRDVSNGDLTYTGRPLDMAIQGEGYYQVDTPLGIRYTRAGSFHIDDTGNLVTQQGYYVLDAAGGAISFQPNDTDIQVTSEGTISANGEIRSTIGVIAFDNPQYLTKAGNSLYKVKDEHIAIANGLPTDQANIKQSFVESSNVNAIKELTTMMQVSRAVGSTSKLIDAMGDMERDAVRRIAELT